MRTSAKSDLIATMDQFIAFIKAFAATTAIRQDFAAYLLVIILGMMVLIPYNRFFFVGLVGCYLLVSLLLLDVLDVRFVLGKLIVGIFTSLILITTAEQIRPYRRRKFILSPTQIALSFVLLLVVGWLGQLWGVRLASVPDHFNLPIYALVAIGLWFIATLHSLLPISTGVFITLLGIELLHSVYYQTWWQMGIWGGIHLLLALSISWIAIWRVNREANTGSV